MKRIVFIILMACNVMAQAQLPILQMGDRRPDFYYWDTNWVDYKFATYPDCIPPDGIPENWTVMWDISNSEDIMGGDLFLGRVCFTETPMKIIGVASPVRFVKIVPNVLDTDLTHRLPEYFRVYQMGGENYTDYTLLGETRWDTTTPQYQMNLSYPFPYPTYESLMDLYEAYFEKPVIVHDTFCVGGTTHNNMQHGLDTDLFGDFPETGYWYTDYLATLYPYMEKTDICTHYLPDPPFYISWHLTHYSAINVTFPGWFVIFDTTPFRRVYPKFNGQLMEFWLPFFAIFDTDFVYEACFGESSGLYVEGQDDTAASVTLAWDDNGAGMWQVSVVPEGVEPDSGMLFFSPINYLQVMELDTGQWYVARIRTWCDSLMYSEWSDTVMFYLHGLQEDTCAVPTWLHVAELDSAMVTLAWNAGDAMAWEVEMGLDEMGMSNSQLMNTATNGVTVEALLITDAWYWARVRALCDTDFWSDWTDTIQFLVPNQHPSGPDTNGSDTTKIVNPVELYTYLMPNPAKEEVTVMSSFKVRSVELYASDGKLLKEQKVNAIGTTLDLNGLPAGVYFVRVRTTAGVTTKRLVVE